MYGQSKKYTQYVLKSELYPSQHFPGGTIAESKNFINELSPKNQFISVRHNEQHTGGDEMGQHSDEAIERWTAKRRAALVWKVLKGETSVPEAARQHGLKVADVEHWQDQYLRAAENGLRRRPKDAEALKEEQIKKLKQQIGELVVKNDVLRRGINPSPLAQEMSDA